MDDQLMKKIRDEIKMLLHASRDCMRNQKRDTSKISFLCKDSYYSETFGVIRGLALAGHGYLGSSNLDAVIEGKSDQPECNLRWWLGKIEEEEVLEEEGFRSDGRCEYCLKKYGIDTKTVQDRKKLEEESLET